MRLTFEKVGLQGDPAPEADAVDDPPELYLGQTHAQVGNAGQGVQVGPRRSPLPTLYRKQVRGRDIC